jgi:hypothetical protein
MLFAAALTAPSQLRVGHPEQLSDDGADRQPRIETFATVIVLVVHRRAEPSVGGNPSQDRLDRRETRIFCLAHHREQLEPEFIIRPVHKLTDGAGGEIGDSHRRSGSALLNPGGEGWVERRQHSGGDAGAIQVGDEITKHYLALLHQGCDCLLSIADGGQPYCTSGLLALSKSAPAISARPARIETYCRSARSSTCALRRSAMRSQTASNGNVSPIIR